MADLLGSILGQMEKPPSMGDEERKKAIERKRELEKAQQQEREQLKAFKLKSQKAITDFLKDDRTQKYKFKPMDKIFRSILHEVSEIAGIASFSFGEDEVDRYVMIWKKEFAPCDEELAAYRKGEEWNPENAKEVARLKELQKQQSEESTSCSIAAEPQTNYRDKYERIIGKQSAIDAAHATMANRSYGFVTSENKRDRRTIEQVMADSRAKKKQKTEEESSLHDASSTENQDVQSTTDTNHDRETGSQ